MSKNKSISLLFVLLLALSFITVTNRTQASTPENTVFSCSDTEAILMGNSVVSAAVDGKAIYVGYQQVGANNQDPIVARFDNGVQVWCRTDYETGGDDGRATVLFWNGTDDGLYIGFTATGTQGNSDADYRRFATNGWLKSYTDGSPGGGGGAKVGVILRVDPATGAGLEGTFVTAVLSSGKTNSVTIDSINLVGSRLSVSARSWFSPRNADKTAMTCTGSSPFNYNLTLSTDLSSVLSASAENCVGNGVELSEQIYLPLVR